jgi:hypothetical protein
VAAFLSGRWRPALEACADAERILRDQCTGVAWELGTVRLFTVWALWNHGELGELCRRVPRLIRDARERGDRYAYTNFRIIAYNLNLAEDDVARARAEATSALEDWSRSGYHLQHNQALNCSGQIDLYDGKGGDAHARMLAEWPKLERAMSLRIQAIRLIMVHLRGRTALAALTARDARFPRGALLRGLRADARRLERERMPVGDAYAHMVRAGRAAAGGDRAATVARLTRAEEAFARAEMWLYHAAARWRLGEHTGDAARVAAGRSYLETHGVRNPGRLLAMLAPGL